VTNDEGADPAADRDRAEVPPEGRVILLSDPRVAAVPVLDDGDPLIDLRELPQLHLDARAADADGAYAQLRAGVAVRLLLAQSRLPDGLRLLVVEAYRSVELQRAIIAGYRQELRLAHPEWAEERLRVETSKFVSPVEVAPHGSGGAVDLTLCHPDGTELDMGTVIDATPEASANACFTGARNISATARRNRSVLAVALSGAGLVNYPTEWWHWSYGDRYWALVTGATHALYGPIGAAAPAAPPATLH
jgi:D-alanyl-D-alanine dipeptidase